MFRHEPAPEREPRARDENTSTASLRKEVIDELIHAFIEMGDAILPVPAHDLLDLFLDQTEVRNSTLQEPSTIERETVREANRTR